MRRRSPRSGRVRKHVGGILRLGDRAAVAKHDDVRVDRLRRVVHGLDGRNGVVERDRSLCADRTLGRQTDVRHQDIGSGPVIATASSGVKT